MSDDTQVEGVTWGEADGDAENTEPVSQPMPPANKADILATAKASRREARHESVRLGCSILLREMTGTDYDAYTMGLRKDSGGYDEATKQRVFDTDLTNARAKLIAYCWIDEDTDERMWSDEEFDQVGQLPTGELDALSKVALELNGIGEEDLEDAVKNSDATPGDSSS